MKVLPKAFVIHKEKRPIFGNGTAQRYAELIALKWRRRTHVEIIARIEIVVAEKFVRTAVEAIRTRLRDDAHLRAGTLSVFRAVGIAQHIELRSEERRVGKECRSRS